MNYKETSVRLSALLIAMIMIFSFSACGDNNEKPEKLSDVDDGSGTTLNDFTGEQQSTDGAVGNTAQDGSEISTQEVSVSAEITEKSSEKVSEEISTEKEPATTAKIPSTKAEILDYYIAAHNMSKSLSKSATQKRGGATNYKGIMEVGGSEAVEKIGRSLMDKYAGVNECNEVYTSRQDILDNAPTKTIKKCSIKESDVKKATCIDKGKYYEVKIYLNCDEKKPEINPTFGSGMTGTVFNILESEEIESYIPGFVSYEKLQLEYMNCYFTAKIEKATGRLLNTYQCYPCILHFGNVIGVSDVKVGIEFVEEWSYSY